MLRNVVAAVLAVSGLCLLAWSLLAPEKDSPLSSDGMTPREFSQESPLVLPGILAQVYEAFGETEEAAIDAIETSGPWEVIFHDYYDDF